MIKNLVKLSILVILILILVIYGRSIYMPLIKKIKGKETVTSIISTIGSDAYARLKPDLNRLNIDDLATDLVLVGLKEERILEVYIKGNDGFNLLKKYPFTAFSGALGPKLKEGDRQIPEGVYKIEYLNPNSSYYLSMKIDYPNKFDKSKTKYSEISKMGNDIFIHGKAATIGCIPIGDEAIEELFYLVQKVEKHRVKVIISPRDFRSNSSFPEIANIDWEEELYTIISQELNSLSHNR